MNVVGTVNLLDAILEAGVKALVHSSSAAVYAVPKESLITEETPCAPINPYGETKPVAERSIEWYARQHGLRAVSLRYFNAAGADPDGQLGEWHIPESHLIPRLLASALDESVSFEIYGTDYPTPDGTCTRVFVHVSDLADAHVLALRALLANGPTGVFNLGTGMGYSVREVIAEMRRHFLAANIKVLERDRRRGDPAMLVADPNRFARAFRWQPHRSDLRTIIKTAKGWALKMEAAASSSPRIMVLRKEHYWG